MTCVREIHREGGGSAGVGPETEDPSGALLPSSSLGTGSSQYSCSSS